SRAFFLALPPPHLSTLFPYTTLFRSGFPMRFPCNIRTRTFVKRRIPLRAALESHSLDEIRPVAQRDVGTSRMNGFVGPLAAEAKDRKSTRLNSSHVAISYAVFCLKKK